MELNLGTFMKRTIIFLIILLMTFTSFACTTKPDPEPETYDVLTHSFYTVVSEKKPEKSLSVALLNTDIRSPLNKKVWTVIDEPDESAGILRLTLVDAISDEYRLYLPTAVSNFGFALVKRHSDQKVFAYAIPVSVISNLETLINPLLEENTTIGTGYFSLLDLADLYDDSWLRPIDEDRTEIIYNASMMLKNNMTPYEGVFDPGMPLRFVYKDHTGLYITAYQQFMDDEVILVTVGESAVGGPNTEIFKAWTDDVLRLENLLGYYPIDWEDTLNLASYQITSVTTLPFMIGFYQTLYPITVPYSSVRDYLEDLLAGTWSETSAVDYSQSRRRILLNTFDETPIYITEEGFLAVDHNLYEGGITYYRNPDFTTNFKDVLLGLAFAAKVPPSNDYVGLTITHLNQIVEWDNAAEFVPLTSEESATLSALLKPQRWFESNYWPYEEGESFGALVTLKDSEGRTYAFDYTEENPSELLYVLMRASDSQTRLVLPMEDFQALLTAVKKIRE